MRAIRDGYRKQCAVAAQNGSFAHVAILVGDLLALLEDADELDRIRQGLLAPDLSRPLERA